MNERVEAVVLAYEDAAIQAIVNSIPRLKHRTPAWKGGVVADEGQLRALAARSIGVKAQHLSSVLLTLQECYDILACRHTGEGILERIANAIAIDGQLTMSILSSGVISLNCYLHKGYF